MTGVLTEDRSTGRWIIFDRPEKLNTFQPDDLTDATAAVEDACSDHRPIIFTGSGARAFSAGMNLDAFLSVIDDPTATRSLMSSLKTFLDTVRQAEVPTIAAVNGHCLGAAFELALVCDFRIATPNALIGLPEMKLGVPCILDSAILAQYVGLNLAKEMILTGRLHDASHLHRYGLLRLAADRDELTSTIDDLLNELADFSAVAIASQKRLFETWQNNGLQDANDLSIDEIVHVFGQDETRRRLIDYGNRLRQSDPEA